MLLLTQRAATQAQELHAAVQDPDPMAWLTCLAHFGRAGQVAAGATWGPGQDGMLLVEQTGTYAVSAHTPAEAHQECTEQLTDSLGASVVVLRCPL